MQRRLFPLLALCWLVPGMAVGGDWHVAEQLVCSDCHTMHNSSAGQPMRYDLSATPAPMLLRHSSSVALCLYCHDGSNLDAPDVVDPVGYVSDPPGGRFSPTVGVANENGHDLGMATGTVPPGGSDPLVLTCITCHDHHGNWAYRNLRPDPAGQSQPPATVVVDQVTHANGSNPTQVYVPSNLTYRSGMSAWCGTCHGAFHGRTGTEEGNASPWFRHPLDQALSTSQHVDYPAWTGVIANRLRVENPNDPRVPSSDDRVFCLTCHKAHGSRQKASLIFADDSTQRSTCQQCHNE